MTFYETLTAAVREFEARGYHSPEQLIEWADKIRTAALSTLTPESEIRSGLTAALNAIYTRQVTGGAMLKIHSGVSRFTLDQVKPQLRAELERRIMSSAGLIKLNRAAAIEGTLQRFSGWATSIPVGGSRAVDKTDVKSDIRKSMASLPFNERRVIIDQSHKFVSSLNNILAVDGGAIAGRWSSRWRRPGYNFREDHKERDQHVYLIRDNWAQAKGLVKAGPDGYTDQITMPAEEVYCSCTYVYLYNLRDMPDNMLTKAGKAALNRS